MSQAVSEKLFHSYDVAGVKVVDFTLPDDLDAMEFDPLNAAMLKLLSDQSSSNWILDLSGVRYMGSAVLGLMVNIRQHIKSARGRLVLCSMSPQLFNIFQNCCLERLFTIAKTRDEAMTRM